MKHSNVLALTSLIAITSLVACGGGSTTAPPYVAPTSNPNSGGGSNATSSVAFYVIVPGGSQVTSKKRRPAFTAPGGTQSVSFTLTTVNGTSTSGTPSVESLSSANASCTPGNNETLCSFTVSAPVGTLLYTVDTYTSADGSGTPTGEGVVQVVTTAGKTTVANTELGGTVATLAVLLGGSAELGGATTIPVYVSAADANGNTILGAYTSAVSFTVTDSDSSGATSLANATQTYSDSTSTSSATLTYTGAAMTTAATIGANVTVPSTGITVTPASFMPDTTAPTINGATTTFAYTGTDAEGYDSAPSPSPTYSYSGTYTVSVATGQTFNGASNLVAITGLQQPTLSSPDNYYYAENDYFDSNAVTYFAWNPQGSTTSLGYVGVSDPTFDEGGPFTPGATNVCAAPYSNQLELPFPSSWNVLSGSGACTYTNNIFAAGSTLNVINADASYNYVFNPCGGCYYEQYAVQSNGASVINCFDEGYDGETATIPAPSSGAANITVTYSSYGGPDPVTPTTPTPPPETVSVPNPWLAFANLGATALANGIPPSPLESDTFTTVGSISALPAGCAVGAGIVPASPTLSEADEAIVDADPLAYQGDAYTTVTIKHYYLSGVGEICNEQVGAGWNMDDDEGGWYTDEDYDVDTYTFDQWTYVTTTSLTATYAHVRSFAQALPATTQAFTAATYALIHSHPQIHRRASAPTSRMRASRARFMSTHVR